MMPTREPRPDRQIGLPGESRSGWDAIWELVLQAEQLPASEQRSFLHSAQTDPSIIRHALAILEGSESLATAARSLPLAPEERFIPQTGMKIGRYRVGTLLGSGGAGSVYAALDEELNRPVAIKFVSSRRNGTAPLREARMASALNHPNIIMIHEVIETGETAGIVMEMVKGVTLRIAARRGPPIDEVLRWSIQLAFALATAHEHGLVHGDIKPENIMVREDGYIKLLDFGAALDAQPFTAPELQFAGTLRYFAPEQCLGLPATQASDVFAFGVVLYELTTGRYPFRAESTFTLLQAITEEEVPRPATFHPGLPPAVDRLISAMLARNPAERPTAREVSDKLAEAAQRPPRRPALPRLAVAGAAALITLLAAAYWFRHATVPSDFSRMTIRPLASQQGLEDNPSISPDGLWISCLYRPRALERPKLQVHSLQGGRPVEIETGGLVMEGPAAWSPDCQELAFSALHDSDQRSIYRVSRTGGVPRKIAECRQQSGRGCELDWSPDGKALVVSDRLPERSELYLLDLTTAGRRDLIAPDSQYLGRPRFSPDGKRVAYVREASLTHSDLYLVAVAGGQPRRVTRTPLIQRGFAWSADGNSLLAISSSQNQKPQFFQIPLDGREPLRVGELDVTRGADPTLSRGKGSLAWVRNMGANSLWRMPVNPSRARPEPLTISAATDIDGDWSRGGRMVFCSDRSGATELWIASASGTRPWQATRSHGPYVGDPHWSPDGRTIAFTSHAKGNPDIFVMQCEPDVEACGEPRQLTRTPASDANPTWSSDGRWIYFSSSRSGGYEVWRIPADGGAAERMTWNGGYMARESADGKWLYYSKLSKAPGFWRIALPTRGPGQPESPIALNVPYKAGATWALGARELFYYPSVEDPAVKFPAIRAVDVQTGHIRELPLENVRLARGLSLSPDGGWLLRSQNDRALQLIMVAE